MKVCIIHIFFGELPPWLSLFLQSCKYNNHLDFLLLTDNRDLQTKAINIKTKFISKGLFDQLATKNLGFQILLNNSYKLCEFKPAFGIIFKDYLEEYDYWGYCDNDLLFGDLRTFLPLRKIGAYDIISTYSNFMSGPYCIYRNSEKINNLFKQISSYKRVYQNPKWCASEENFIGFSSFQSYCWRLNRKIGFYIYNKFKKGNSLSQKFNNYWIYKKTRMNSNSPKDISEVVWREQEKGNIKVLFEGLLKSDREYKREQQTDWKIIWDKGKLYQNSLENDILAFHFVDSKSNSEFKASFIKAADKITLTSSGQN